MPVVEFRAPEPRSGAPVPADLLLKAVMERSGEWACIATYGSGRSASSFVSRIRRTTADSLPGRFLFTVRTCPSGADVFAMWLDEDEGAR